MGRLFQVWIVHLSQRYADEKEAARAYDTAVRKIHGGMAHGTYIQGQNNRGGAQVWLNFPTAKETAGLVQRKHREATHIALVKSRRDAGLSASIYTGVSWDFEKRTWTAQLGKRVDVAGPPKPKFTYAVDPITAKRKRVYETALSRRPVGPTVHIGRFVDEAEAARAWDAAVRLQEGVLAHQGGRLNFPTREEITTDRNSPAAS